MHGTWRRLEFYGSGGEFECFERVGLLAGWLCGWLGAQTRARRSVNGTLRGTFL